MYELRNFQVVQLRSMTVYPNENFSASFKPPKGKQFVCVLLGVEDKKDDGQKLDLLAAMDRMGWMPKDPAMVEHLKVEADAD